MTRYEHVEVEIEYEDSLKNTLISAYNVKLSEYLCSYIQKRFCLKIGDLLRISFEFVDYHGHDMRNLVVQQFACVKVAFSSRNLWAKE